MRTWNFCKFAQVDSVLSADGRRPVRRPSVYANFSSRLLPYWISSLRAIHLHCCVVGVK